MGSRRTLAKSSATPKFSFAEVSWMMALMDRANCSARARETTRSSARSPLLHAIASTRFFSATFVLSSSTQSFIVLNELGRGVVMARARASAGRGRDTGRRGGAETSIVRASRMTAREGAPVLTRPALAHMPLARLADASQRPPHTPAVNSVSRPSSGARAPLIGDVEAHNRRGRVAIIHRRHRSEALLARSIPYLDLGRVPFLRRDALRQEERADRGLLSDIEVPLDEAQNEARLADALVAEQHYLELILLLRRAVKGERHGSRAEHAEGAATGAPPVD